MLSKIPGVTLETSDKILKLYMLDAIMEGDVTIEQLADIQKTEKRKIGTTNAINILHFFLNDPVTVEDVEDSN